MRRTIQVIIRSVLLLPLLVFVAHLAAAQTATVRPGALPAEDPKLRAEAVSLLERANHVSAPAVWGSNELTLHFHVPNPVDGQPNDGDYVSDVAAPGVRQQEWHYALIKSSKFATACESAICTTTFRSPWRSSGCSV